MTTHRALIGLHGRNHPQYHPADYQVIRQARIEAVKTLIYTPNPVYERCLEINPDMRFIVRLGHAEEFGLNDDGTGRHPAPEQFVARNLPDMERVRSFSNRFELHNEPNHVACYEGWGAEVEDARRFARWCDDVLRRLRRQALWASLGFPGLAIHHPGWQGDIPWLEACRAQVEQCDWLGCHCYWQADNMLDSEWGLRFTRYHQLFPGLPLEITEFGNATQGLSDRRMAEEYVRYYSELARHPYVGSACAFILSSHDPAWSRFVWRKESGEQRPVVEAVGQIERLPPPVEPPEEPQALPGPAPLPPLQAVYAQLPVHESKRYPLRPLEAVKLVVIHYTFAAGDLSPAAIARYQVSQGRAGIGYHYYITADGSIYQTNRLQTEAQHTDSRNHDTVGVALAGKFQDAAPPAEQLESAARICAHLVAGLGLASADVVGRMEVDDGHPSPGPQFLEGVRWKEALVTRIDDILRAAGYAPGETEDLAALRRRLRQLEERVRRLLALTGALAVDPPPVIDVHDSLPTHPTRSYARRDPASVDRVVVHYTYTRTDVTPEQVARYQVDQGKPGITYHYLILGDGVVYQTNSLRTVSQHTNLAEVNAGGVGVAFAGRFTASGPQPAQLAAGAQLCAHLLGRFGLPVTALVGRSELEPDIVSPGQTWLEGPRWKDALLAEIEQRLAAGAAESALQKLQAALARQEAEIAALRQEVALWKRRATEGWRVDRPAIVDVVDSLPRHPNKTYDTRPLEGIQWIAIHHSEAPPDLPPQRVAEFHISPARNWPGIAYHYYITGDGVIYQTNRLQTRSYHVGDSNASALGICLAGYFTADRDVQPSDAQIESCGRLAAWLLQELKLPIEQVVGHREVPKASSGCPGPNWRGGLHWQERLYAQIRALRGAESPARPVFYPLTPADGGVPYAPADHALPPAWWRQRSEIAPATDGPGNGRRQGPAVAEMAEQR